LHRVRDALRLHFALRPFLALDFDFRVHALQFLRGRELP
jgi:hypothetical protein